MRRITIPAAATAIAVLLAATALAPSPAAAGRGDLRESRSFSKTLAFSDTHGGPGTGAPRRLVVDDVNGSITVTGDGGDDVRAEITETVTADSADRMAAARAEVTLEIDERDNTVRFYVDGPFHDPRGGINWDNPGYQVAYDFAIRVPREVDVVLKTVNGGEVLVSGVSGRYEVRNVNGGVEARDLAGSGTVTAVNGPVKVTFADNPDGDSTFTTVNGDVDLAFRDGFGAEVEVKTLNGDTYADFPVSVVGSPPVAAEKKKGRTVYRRGRAMHLRVGQGGPRLEMETVNGDILLRNRDSR